MAGINLSKGGTINLSKATNDSLEKMFVGLYWDKITKEETRKTGGFFGIGGKTEVVRTNEKNVDLDASILCYSGDCRVETCYWSNPTLHERGKIYIQSSGDDTTGDNKKGDGGDNETIMIDFTNIPSNIDTLIVILNSFSGDKLDEVPNSGIRVYEGDVSDPSKVHASFEVSGNDVAKGKRSMVVGTIKRDNDNSWHFTAIGDTYTDQYIDGVASNCGKYL